MECGRKLFWKRSKRAPFSFENGLVCTGPQTTQNLVIPRCCFAEDDKEMYKDSQRKCTAIVLLIKPFVWWRSLYRRRRGLLKFSCYLFTAWNWRNFPPWKTRLKIGKLFHVITERALIPRLTVSLSHLKEKTRACIAYQAYHNLAPPSITDLFTKHATSYNFDLSHTYWKGNSDFFTHWASLIWNSLPVKIRAGLFKAWLS